jgi:hypothetical protein
MKMRIAIYSFLLVSVTSLQGAVLTFVNTTNAGHTFVYSGFVQNNQQLHTGDSFIVFDFAGFVNGQGPSSDWTFSTINNVPDQPDNPTIVDAVFTYNGTLIVGQPGNTPLGIFTLTTTFLSQTEGTYIFSTIRTQGAQAGELVVQSGTTTVPTGVPEPISFCLVGAGLVGLGCAHRRRSSVN